MPNYLLGYGERLMQAVPPPGSIPDKWHPYTFDEAKARLGPKVKSVYRTIAALPDDACPGGEAVVLMTLHPSYLAKSYYPEDFLAAADLRAVGSRARSVVPDVQVPSKEGQSQVAPEFFIAGRRESIFALPAKAAEWREGSKAAQDFSKIFDFRSLKANRKVVVNSDLTGVWEVVLHADAFSTGQEILQAFAAFAENHGAEAVLDRRLHAGGLCFLPVRADEETIRSVAEFAFLRVARSMPRLRPLLRMVDSPTTFRCEVPKTKALDQDVRVAIFDVGPATAKGMEPWVRNIEPDDLDEAHDEACDHGTGVASALLFGNIEHGKPLPQPYCNVDVIRVVDEGSDEDDEEYFNVLHRIVAALANRNYDFVNMSIGPDWPVEDAEPHAWTAVLDQQFKELGIVPFCAVGNSGELDWASGNARVQPPSDCVNAFAIGACDSIHNDWQRTPYSSVGPGRSPGVVRPEAVAFGGCGKTPFYALESGSNRAVPLQGTSFAAPLAMRAAVGVRAHLGPILRPIAIKALLINRCDPRGDRMMREVGWGRLRTEVEELLVSDDSTVHVIYQHSLSPGQWMRAPIPVPAEQMKGMVRVTSTVCYLTDTDPQDPLNYTRAGLEVAFRPHNGKFESEDSKNPLTKPFFSSANMYKSSEAELREDAHKWETVIHYSANMRGSSLQEPCMDIHYNARRGGAANKNAGSVQFALVVTIEARKEPKLYNKISTRYRTKLEALTPIKIPISLRT